MDTIPHTEHSKFYIINTFVCDGEEYVVVDVCEQPFKCFPDTYFVNTTTNSAIFVTNEYKFGIKEAKINKTNKEILLFGCFWGNANNGINIY